MIWKDLQHRNGVKYRGEFMFEKNMKQVNQLMTRIYRLCSVAILALVACSWTGIFEFGREYTMIILIAGLIIAVTPGILIRFLPDRVLRDYMLFMTAVFIGILGTNNHIGVYITYVLVPVFSCLYFEPKLVMKAGIFSYLVMVAAVYINSAGTYDVLYLGRPRNQMFLAYILGFTIEYVIVMAVLYDLVKRAKKMMEARYSAEEENRMKSQFLSSMSHEIRTPMNAIIGMADVALREEMSENLKKDINIIKSSSEGLLEIVNDILDLSKIEAGKINIIEDNYTTESLTADIEAIINARNVKKKIPLYYHIQGDMPHILCGDAVRLKQVMLNYASNAIKYTESGRIDVTIRCTEAKDGYVNLVYTVKDTGIGVRKEDMEKLFVMYSQLESRKNHGKEGTGIGLAISKAFVEEMNGTVHVESVYGKGSEFSFTVPQKIIQEEPELEACHTENHEKFFATKGVRVLLADDNDINREVLKALLDPFGFVIDEAENGKVAVDMAEKILYDLILMDSHMPVMSGKEAAGKIRGNAGGLNQKTPIIAVTADAITGVKEDLLSSGMDDYIAKPVDVEQLCSTIKRYLPEEKIA